MQFLGRVLKTNQHWSATGSQPFAFLSKNSDTFSQFKNLVGILEIYYRQDYLSGRTKPQWQ